LCLYFLHGATHIAGDGIAGLSLSKTVQHLNYATRPEPPERQATKKPTWTEPLFEGLVHVGLLVNSPTKFWSATYLVIRNSVWL